MKSDSSAEIYGKLLRKGVKCLEIDMWDGIDGFPIGNFGEKNIFFRDESFFITTGCFEFLVIF